VIPGLAGLEWWLALGLVYLIGRAQDWWNE
jgi:hypothetical protein